MLEILLAEPRTRPVQQILPLIFPLTVVANLSHFHDFNKHTSLINVFFLYLPLIVAPQITPFTFAQESMNVGDTGSLTCTIIKGDNPVNISWLHNNKVIENEAGISTVLLGKRISTLTVDSIQAEHSGEYTCLARNAAGSDRFIVRLAVNGSDCTC